MDFVFGQTVLFPGADHAAENRAFREALQAVIAGASRRQFRGKLRGLYRDAPFDEACQEIHALADRYIDAALEHLGTTGKDDADAAKVRAGGSSSDAVSGCRPVFLFELIRRSSRDRSHIRNQLLTVFLGGHDSTAILVSNALFLLSRNSAAWAKLRQEVLPLQDRQLLSFTKLKGLPYVRYVLNESKP